MRSKTQGHLTNKQAQKSRSTAHTTSPIDESLSQAAAQALSAPNTLSPKNALQLQRAVGNRALAQRLPVAVTPTRSATRIQRQSLDELYGDLAKESNEKQEYLADFKKVQTLLKDKNKVLGLLRQSLLQNKQWEQGLANFEGNANFNVARPTLIGAVPATFFRAMVSGGQAFEDMLGGSHGIHSHRIQW